MTKLEAMNMLLMSSGQLPVQSYDSNHPDAITAREYLERWNDQCQQRGWYFNTFYNLDLPLGPENHIALPAGTVRVDILSQCGQGIPRQNKLWNSAKNSYVWDAPQVGNVFTVIDFDDCPLSAQTYIAYSALVEWQTFTEGDQLKIQQAARISTGSRVQLNREQIRFENNNVLKRPTTIQFLGRQQRQGAGGFNPTFPGGKGY